MTALLTRFSYESCSPTKVSVRDAASSAAAASAALTSSLHRSGMADWIKLDEQASRQYLDATTLFAELEAAQAHVQECSGGMLWRTIKGREYLIQTGKDNRQRSRGRRSQATEAIYEAFIARKREAQETLRELRHQSDLVYRRNRALRVGYAPALLVRILTSMERLELREDAMIAGECALFAYTAQAFVRPPARLADAAGCEPLQLQILAAGERAKDRVFAALRVADKTFMASEIAEDRLQVINSRGASVEIVYGGLMQVLLKPDILTAMRRFSVPVVARSGRMARMNAISPSLYVMHADCSTLRSGVTVAEAREFERRSHAARSLVKNYLPDWNEGWTSR